MAVSFAGCKGGGSASKLPEIVKVGFIAPLTGSSSSYGQSSRNGLQLLEDQMNQMGGIGGKKVQVLYADDGAITANSVTVGKKLITGDKVAAILDPATDPGAASLAAVCQKNNVPMITCTGTGGDITSAGDYIFHTCFPDTFQGKVMAEFAAGDMKVQTAAILSNSGDDYSKSLAEAFRSSFSGKIVDVETFPTGCKDFSAQLTKIANQKPEVLFLPEHAGDAATIAKAARSMGITATFLGGDGFDSPELFSVGGEAVNGAYFCGYFSDADKSQQTAQFIREYKAKYGSSPDTVAALTYDAGRVLFDSIRKAGSTDAAAVKNALKSYNGNLVCGHISFDNSRNAVQQACIIKTIDGRNTLYKKIGT